jgi:phytol kinase
MVIDILLSALLMVYTGLVLYLTKHIYLYLLNRGTDSKDAVYFNRKFVHIFAGGVVALFVPLYDSPYFPLIAGVLLAAVTLFTHERGDRLYWFQNKKDFNDVTFCLMWGISIFGLWMLIGSPWIAILPALFMAFGDGVTGIIRNGFFGKRSKHYIGNVFMAFTCIPIGYMFGLLGGLAFGGLLAGLIASAIEHFEFGPIDDNILISVSSSVILVFMYHFQYGIFISF